MPSVLALGDGDIRQALESLNLVIVGESLLTNGAEWTVKIPSYRTDLDRPIDLVEEVLRVYGTERVPSAPSGLRRGQR